METFPLILSLLCSLSADYLFLFTPYDLAGVFLFILVQYFHRAQIGIPLRIWLKQGMFFAALLFISLSLLIVKGSLLLAAALSYFCLLCCNFICAWRRSYRQLPLSFCICLSLLLICDFHVGLYNMPRFLPSLPEPLFLYCHGIAYRLIWICYLPSQCIVFWLFLRSLRHA